eukprot:gene22461-29576_t
MCAHNGWRIITCVLKQGWNVIHIVAYTGLAHNDTCVLKQAGAVIHILLNELGRRLAQATGFFIPVAPLLLEMLQWAELHKPPKGGKGTAPDMSLQLRAGMSMLRTTAFQEEVVLEVLELLADHLAQWSCSIAFPELSHLVLLQLRRFNKASPVERFRRFVRQFLEAIEKNVSWVGNQRDRVEFSPKDISKVQEFLKQEHASEKAPMQAFNKLLVQKAGSRQAMHATSAVKLGKGSKGKRSKEDSEDEDEGESDDGDLDMKPRKKKAKAVEEESEEESDEEKPVKLKKTKSDDGEMDMCPSKKKTEAVQEESEVCEEDEPVKSKKGKGS